MFSEAEYNPVGSYIKRFELDLELCSKIVRICFEGVEEAMYLWLNGQFVGDAEDSFTPVSYTHLDVYKRQLIWCVLMGKQYPSDHCTGHYTNAGCKSKWNVQAEQIQLCICKLLPSAGSVCRLYGKYPADAAIYCNDLFR